MAYEFKRLGEVEALVEVPEGANALIEVDGDIKRVPGGVLGGEAGIKTAIIKDSEYDNCIAGISTMSAAAPVTYECINMTFEEAYETMLNGEPLATLGMFAGEGAMNFYGITAFIGTALGVPCIQIMFSFGSSALSMLFWTADGISTEEPSSGSDK
jgi:hypothetical protein